MSEAGSNPYYGNGGRPSAPYAPDYDHQNNVPADIPPQDTTGYPNMQNTTNEGTNFNSVDIESKPNRTDVSSSNSSPKNKKCCKIVVITVIVLLIIGGLIALITVLAIGGNKMNIVIQSANTKEKWLDIIVSEFMATKPKLKGRPIEIAVHHTGSTLKKDLKPDIWSPANAQFIRIQGTEDSVTYVSNQPQLCFPIANIPVGIAMWKTLAEAMGWPNKDIGFRDIGELALDPQGWNRYNLSFGDFRYGHGHPDSSNSGRLSVVASMIAFMNQSGLNTASDVVSAANNADVQAIVRSVMHLGKIDTDLLARMRDHGPTYLHAVANYESNVVNWNLDYASRITSHGYGGWVFVYLSDGTYWMTHPLCVVDGASWSDKTKIEAAKMFAKYASKDESKKKLLKYGIRPFDVSDISCCGSTITLANGANPTKSIENIQTLTYPTDTIMSEVLSQWSTLKKPAAFAVVIDTSGSMGLFDGYDKNRLYYAKEALKIFIGSCNKNDYLNIRGFTNNPGPYSGNDKIFIDGIKSAKETQMKTWVGYLGATGSTPLYSAMIEAWKTLNNTKISNEANNIIWNYGIVAMTDGAPDSDQATQLQRFYNELGYSQTTEGSTDSNIIHIYNVIFGESGISAATDLQKLSSVSGGKYFFADRTDLSDVYYQLSLEI